MIGITDVNEPGGRAGCFPGGGAAHLVRATSQPRFVAPVSAAPPGRHAGTVAGPLKRKKPIRQDGLFTCLMPGSLWRASCPPPSGPLLRNVQIRSRRICPGQESAHRQTTDKTKGPVFRLSLSLLFDAWQFPTLAWGDPTLPSALRRFTSEFGMGSGGTTALQPPGKFCLSTHLLGMSM